MRVPSLYLSCLTFSPEQREQIAILVPGSQGRPAIKLSASASSFDSFTVSEPSPEKVGVGAGSRVTAEPANRHRPPLLRLATKGRQSERRINIATFFEVRKIAMVGTLTKIGWEDLKGRGEGSITGSLSGFRPARILRGGNFRAAFCGRLALLGCGGHTADWWPTLCVVPVNRALTYCRWAISASSSAIMSICSRGNVWGRYPQRGRGAGADLRLAGIRGFRDSYRGCTLQWPGSFPLGLMSFRTTYDLILSCTSPD
jgi:hypothetical protein